MTRRSLRQLRPLVEQRVAIYKNADQRHARKVVQTLNTPKPKVVWTQTLDFGLGAADSNLCATMPDTAQPAARATRVILVVAAMIYVLDQLTKWLVLRGISFGEEIVVIPGFFNLTYRVNTGAAWSLFTGNNFVLAGIALFALVALFLARRHFGADRLLGRLALGMVFGGIVGNLTDRLLPSRHAVVDFLHFYMVRRGTMEVWDFPAFNVADSAICAGVALIFLINWKNAPVTKIAS